MSMKFTHVIGMNKTDVQKNFESILTNFELNPTKYKTLTFFNL